MVTPWKASSNIYDSTHPIHYYLCIKRMKLIFIIIRFLVLARPIDMKMGSVYRANNLWQTAKVFKSIY
jgi:hypothetical protein